MFKTSNIGTTIISMCLAMEIIAQVMGCLIFPWSQYQHELINFYNGVCTGFMALYLIIKATD